MQEISSLAFSHECKSLRPEALRLWRHQWENKLQSLSTNSPCDTPGIWIFENWLVQTASPNRTIHLFKCPISSSEFDDQMPLFKFLVYTIGKLVTHLRKYYKSDISPPCIPLDKKKGKTCRFSFKFPTPSMIVQIPPPSALWLSRHLKMVKYPAYAEGRVSFFKVPMIEEKTLQILALLSPPLSPKTATPVCHVIIFLGICFYSMYSGGCCFSFQVPDVSFHSFYSQEKHSKKIRIKSM